MKLAWLALLLISTGQVPAKSRTALVESITVQSSWGGLGKPRRSELLIERKGKDYIANGHLIRSEQVQALFNAVEEPSTAGPVLANVGITAGWLRDRVNTAGKFATYVDYVTGTEDQKQLFRSAFVDQAMAQRRLETLYQSFHTDDYRT